MNGFGTPDRRTIQKRSFRSKLDDNTRGGAQCVAVKALPRHWCHGAIRKAARTCMTFALGHPLLRAEQIRYWVLGWRSRCWLGCLEQLFFLSLLRV